MTPKDILDMTYIMFKNVIEGIGRKLNWDMKMALASLSPDINQEDFPLFTKSNEEKVFRMSDALALQSRAQGS
ncbi:hypothetical protein [Paenibacillus sp. MMO-177]|uniref:hypothetical protein n=1 Tax=Paenibacillus sp. MMO-177 TaxID=3081289 RepID=UPI0030171298